MKLGTAIRAGVAGGCLGLVLLSAAAAGLSVPASRAGRTTTVVTADALKPSACGALALTAIVKGSGIFSGGAAAELIVGSGGVDTINGGDGDDTLSGGLGNDVCIGGPGTDENGVLVLLVRTDQCETFIQ